MRPRGRRFASISGEAVRGSRKKTLDSPDTLRLNRPVLRDLALETQRLRVGRQQQFDRRRVARLYEELFEQTARPAAS